MAIPCILNTDFIGLNRLHHDYIKGSASTIVSSEKNVDISMTPRPTINQTSNQNLSSFFCSEEERRLNTNFVGLHHLRNGCIKGTTSKIISSEKKIDTSGTPRPMVDQTSNQNFASFFCSEDERRLDTDFIGLNHLRNGCIEGRT